MTATYTLNAEHQGIEITFPGKPAQTIIDSLKAVGYRWHKVKALWYAKQSPDTLALAQSLADGEAPAAKPESKPALPIDTPEAIAAYKSIVTSLWPNDDPGDSKMRDYCMKEKKHIVRLPNGVVFTIEKPQIETKFCFGYSSCGQGPEWNEAIKAEDKARASEAHFIQENMKGFDQTLREIDGWNGRDSKCGPILKACNSKAPIYYAFQTPYWNEINRCITIDAYYKHPGEFVHSEWSNCDYYIPTESDLAIIRAAYQIAHDEHEKRVRAYLKRYGLSKIKTWTYWIDD